MTRLNPLIARLSRSQIHGTGATMLLLLGVAIALAAVPAWSRWSEQTQLASSVRSAALRANATHARIDALRRDLVSARAAAAGQEARQGTIDQRLLSVSALATAHHVTLDSVEPGAAPQREADVRVPVAVSARGTYPDLLSWLHEIRTTLPDLAIVTAQISTAANGRCSCRLTLNYWIAPTAKSASAVATAGTGSTP